MDFLRIGENKLKITLTEEELLFYGLELSSLSYSSTETRRAFWAILDDAKHATGFDAAASKVSVQIYTSHDGGCEMYIIGDDSAHPANSDAVRDEAIAKASAANEDATLLSSSLEAKLDGKKMIESGLTVTPSVSRHFEKAVGEFESITNLLSACLALEKNGYDGESSAWQVKDRYYLYLKGSPAAPSRQKKEKVSASGVIWEFGSPARDITLPYLAEHGVPICNVNAVGQLSGIAL